MNKKTFVAGVNGYVDLYGEITFLNLGDRKEAQDLVEKNQIIPFEVKRDTLKKRDNISTFEIR